MNATERRQSNRGRYGNDFAVGEDRAPHYPGCCCFNRMQGGELLHSGYPTDTGPCYESESSSDPGFYPLV